MRWPAWVWLCGVALVFLIRFPIHFALSSPPYLMDFEVYRAVAQRVAEGEGSHLYDPTTSEAMMFKYAPIWALAWLPLAWTPAHAGAVVWMTLTVLWLLLACLGAHRLCEEAGLRAPPWISVVVAALLSRPLWAEFLNGQVDLLWALLVIGFLVATVKRQPWWAACSLALAIALKLPALIFLLALFVRRRIKAALRVCLIFAVLNVVACLFLDPAHPLQLAKDWAQVLWESGPSRAFEIGNQSLLALTSRFLSADGYQLNLLALPPLAVVLVTLGVSGVLFVTVVHHHPAQRQGQASWVFDGALLTIVMVLCSPTVWTATYSALVLPITVAASLALASPHTAWRSPSSAILALAVGTLSLMTHSSFWKMLGVRTFRHESYVFLVLMVLPWLGLALFAYLVAARRTSCS